MWNEGGWATVPLERATRRGRALNLSIGMSLEGSMEGLRESDPNPDWRREMGESSIEGRRLAAADIACALCVVYGVVAFVG